MKTILIIEDNEADRFLGEMIIRSARPEIQIIKAHDGRAAIDMLLKEGSEPDLILLDINMPRMNGHQFLEEFTDHNSREIPVVVMLTSSDQEQDKDRAFFYNCVKDYLIKPIKKENIDKLEKLVHGSS